MDVTVHIPDELAKRLGDTGEVERRIVEAFVLEEFKLGHLTVHEIRELLGFATRMQLDAFLKTHAVYEDYTLEDLERERQGLRRLGF